MKFEYLMKKYILTILVIFFSGFYVFSQNVNSLNVLNYGAKGDGKTLNTESFIKAFNDLKVKKSSVLEIPEGDFLLSCLKVNISNVKIVGKGRIISYSTKGGVLLQIDGDGNSIEGISFLEKDFARELLNINGSNNKIKRVSFDTQGKSKSQKVIYSDRLLHMSNDNGTNNLIEDCQFKNGRVGIGLNGSSNVKNCKITHNIIGILVRPSGRNSEISYNNISYNDVNGKAGNDGILAQRNVDNLYIHNNVISFSGEHGIYLQGSNCKIENNKIYNNRKSGIKIASYNDQLFNYTSKFNYIGTNNIISGNTIYDNSFENKVNAGIYLQAPLKNIFVENNTCYGNFYGIRSTSVVSKRGDNSRVVLKNIVISNNQLINNRDFSLRIEGEDGIRIENNTGDNILITTRDSKIKMNSLILKKNILKRVSLNNINGGQIEDNKVDEIDNRGTNVNLSSGNLKLKNQIRTSKK